MAIPADLWVVVLAAGEGSRLVDWTRDGEGRPVPKQFYSFTGGSSMLARTLARARRLAPATRILTVVADHHREWWEKEFADYPAGGVVVQPRNRGTAAGILLPLVRVLLRDPDGIVLVLPSDHHVEQEEVLRQTTLRAIGHVARDPASVVLLGIEAEEADPEYGWIVPGPGGETAPRRVRRFVEKPGLAEALRLMAQGALVNSFIFVATARQLLRLYEASLPSLLRDFLMCLPLVARGPVPLQALYRSLPARDFSRDVLEPMSERLRVLQVPGCGWTDLGTPRRLARWMEGRAAPRGLPAGVMATRPRKAVGIPA